MWSIRTNIEEPVSGCDGWVKRRSWECPFDQNPECPQIVPDWPTQGHYHGHCQDEHIKISFFAVTMTSTVIAIPRLTQSCQSNTNMVGYHRLPLVASNLCLHKAITENTRWARACISSVERRRADLGWGGVAPISMLMPSPLEPCPTQNIPPLFVLGKHLPTSEDSACLFLWLILNMLSSFFLT